MIYTDEKLFEILEQRKDIKVSFDDEYSFTEVPSVVSILFVCAVSIESLFNENDGDDVRVKFEVFEKSLYIFCSIFNEIGNELVKIKIKKETPYNLASSYFMCRSGSTDITDYFFNLMCQRVKDSVKSIWPVIFEDL